MGRRLHTVTSMVSLVACMAAIGLWVRSYRISDELMIGYWNYGRHPKHADYEAATGAALVRCRGASRFSIFTACVGYHGGIVRTGPGTNGRHWFFSHADAAEVADGPSLTQLHGWAGFKYKHHSRTDELWIPDYAVVGVAAVLPLIWAFRWLRRSSAHAAQRCSTCGYDLRASKDRCPECGTPMATAE